MLPPGDIGTLQDILRTREFQNSKSPYRSIVISDRIKFVPVHSNINDPPLAIFDGCQSYLKWREFLVAFKLDCDYG